jgi:hypothetical protein
VILGLVIAVFSLGRRMHVLGNELPVPMPWAPLGRLPVLVDVVPNRMSIFVVLCAVVVVALFMERVMRAAPAMRAVGWAAIALVVISLVPVPPIASSGVAPAFFTSPSIQRIPEGSLVLVAPFATPTPRRIHDEAMLWQAIADMRFKMPEGYAIGPGPTDSPPDSATQREMIAIAEAPRAVAPPPASPATISQVAAEWRSWGVQFVVVGPMRNQDAMLALVRSAAGSQGTEVDGVWLWDLRGSGPG